MKLSKNSIWLKAYNYSSHKEYDIVEYYKPKSICQLFWGSMFGFLSAITFLPMTIVNIISYLFTRYVINGFFYHMFGSIGIIVIPFIAYNFRRGSDETVISFYTWFIGLLIIIGIIIGFIAIFMFAGFIIDIKSKRVKKPSVIGSYIKAKKNKICPPIEWTE